MPFSDCSEPHHSLQVPHVFPVSLSLRWSHRKLFHRQNRWPSLDSLIPCPLYQQPSYTMLSWPSASNIQGRNVPPSALSTVLFIVLVLSFPINCPLNLDDPNPPSLLNPSPTTEKREQVSPNLNVLSHFYTLSSSYSPHFPLFKAKYLESCPLSVYLDSIIHVSIQPPKCSHQEYLWAPHHTTQWTLFNLHPVTLQLLLSTITSSIIYLFYFYSKLLIIVGNYRAGIIVEISLDLKHINKQVIYSTQTRVGLLVFTYQRDQIWNL